MFKAKIRTSFSRVGNVRTRRVHLQFLNEDICIYVHTYAYIVDLLNTLLVFKNIHT